MKAVHFISNLGPGDLVIRVQQLKRSERTPPKIATLSS